MRSGTHTESYGVLADIRMCGVRPARDVGWHRAPAPARIDIFLVAIFVALEVLSERQVAVGQRWALRLDAPCQEEAGEPYALGRDGIVVEGVAGEGMEGVECIGDSPYGIVAEDGSESIVALRAPHKCHRGVCTRGSEVRDGVAKLVGEHHIVEQQLATVARYRTANGDIVARAAIVSEADRVEHGVECGSDGVDGYEIGRVAVVVHHTDDIRGSYVAVAQCPGVEHQVEVTDVVGTLVNRRQHNV